ncbi:hypothetical protein DACRYDRAFT_112658 [Dacryopinax primogenitus]|uniref:Uncharacterized protein n=1 Tax=Dacryopinax primogenitus (strain DJM 731) TaxID=1858805 RepID=M5FPP6_DACPD|nr:uncharacterized protein DACRYDRAFT_112658 [Dacryopinax primogenitus]EJT96549.1 hypothetical protein DACRYDRAFT_112658 [Dacryopinax primogenitus]
MLPPSPDSDHPAVDTSDEYEYSEGSDGTVNELKGWEELDSTPKLLGSTSSQSEPNERSQADLKQRWEGGIRVETFIGGEGELRTVYGCRSVEEAEKSIKDWPKPDKKRIYNARVFVVEHDEKTNQFSESMVGIVFPSRFGRTPSGSKLYVYPPEDRAAEEVAWRELLE